MSTARFINPPPPNLCVCVSLLSLLGKGLVKCLPPFIARQRLCEHVPAAIEELLDACVYESVYPSIVARYQLGKDVPATTNYWRRHSMRSMSYR
jgi:hypothetical protein